MAKKLKNVPLYQKVVDLIMERLVSGYWRVGEKLPNEFLIAEEFGVSQGTVRKALMILEKRGLLKRAPSKGTIVAGTSEEESRFAFFKMRNENGRMVVPKLVSETIKILEPDENDREVFGKKISSITQLVRVRENNKRPFVVDYIRLNGDMTSGLAQRSPLPSSLYPFLSSRYNITIMHAKEELKASLADQNIAQQLECKVGEPVLECHRFAYDLKDNCVETRISYYLTGFATYQVHLSRELKSE